MKTCVAVTFFFGLVFVISADQHLDCDELGFEDVTAPTAGQFATTHASINNGKRILYNAACLYAIQFK